MEKCPNCGEATVSIKTKLSLAPGDCHICTYCKAKLKVETYAYAVHLVYGLIVIYGIWQLPLLTAVITALAATFIAFGVILKGIPLKVEESDEPYKKQESKED